jgi:hypothetical protein
VPRLSSLSPAGRHRAGLLAAACAVAFGCVPAVAQVAVDSDPLAPKLATGATKKPPMFQKFSQPAQAELGPPLNFTPPPSGVGNTGFDSTNSRKAKTKAGARKKTTAKARGGARALVSDETPAPAVSPYQKPFQATGNGVYASARAAPPAEPVPINKARAKRKAHVEPDDPYAPLGLRAGAFTLFPAIELSGGYDSNPQQASSPKGAAIYNVAPEMRVQSNWSRHELKAELRGGFTGYSPDTEPTLSRPKFDGKVDGRVDVTRTTRIDLGGRALVATDNPGSPDLQAGLAKLPIYTTFGGSLGVGQKFNRFDLSVKGDAERTAYQDSELTNGVTVSNEERNYDQYGVTLRGGYELSPGVTPFVEGRLDTRKHDNVVDSSGYRRDSKGLTGKVGTTFELSRLLTGEISLGYTQRKYDDSRLENLSGLIGDASLVWTANSLTTVKLTASSSIAETTLAGVSGELSRDVGVQVDHAFRRWLIGNVKFGFGLDDYVGSSREDKRYSAGLGLTYKLNRSVHLKGEFRQDGLRSNVSGNDYEASVFMLGVRVQR